MGNPRPVAVCWPDDRLRVNDPSQVSPPAAAMRPNERFIGPIFDESGICFFLVYNSKLKIFHYLLDETVKVPTNSSPAGAVAASLSASARALRSIAITVASEKF